MSSVRNSQAELDDLIHDLEAEDKRGSVASNRISINPGAMSLDDLMNSLESGPPTGGVKVIEERGAVQLRQVPKDELPKGHASLMLLQEKGGHYDAVKERERDEVELNDLITNLDSLGGPPPRERPISRPPPAEAPPPPPPGTLPRGNNYGYTTTAAPRVESYQPAAPSSTASMPYQGMQSNLDAASTYLSSVELEIIKEINALRTRPDSFVRDLELRAAQFKGKDLQVGNKMLRTREGSGPVADAAAQLAATQPVPPLRVSRGMSAAARASVVTNGRSGATTSDTINRLPDHGRPNGHCMELMGFGDAPPRELIIRMIVCDGDSARQQRRVLLDPKWAYVGVGFGDHSGGAFKKMLSIALSTNYEDN